MCILASLLCLYLGSWQWDRKESLDFKNSLITNNYDAAPLNFSQNPEVFAHFDEKNQWHPVTLEGHYLSDHQLLVRNRPYEGLNGYEVLVPFEANNGHVVVIDRGWVPADSVHSGDAASNIPAPPEGNVTVTARVHKGESSLDKDAPAGQISSIDLKKVKEITSAPVDEGAYGLLSSESPEPAQTPAKASKPDLDTGPNLSYSVQWVVFAAMCYFAYFWLARQKVRNDQIDAQIAAELDAYYRQFYDENGNYIGEEDEAVVLRKMQMVDDMPAHMKSIVRPKFTKKRAELSDEEEEDAILDQHRHS